MRPQAPTIPTRESALEAGFFLALVALPLVFTPFTEAPFADPKLLALVASATVVALARPRVSRPITWAAGAWVGTVFLAAFAGIDPWWSFLGPENQAIGAIALSACAFLLCAATGARDPLVDRAASWLFWTGVAVATLAVVGRFVDIGGQTWELGRFSSTIGYRVYVGGFLAAALLAATARRVGGAEIAGLVAIASGLSVSAVRSAWLGAGVGLLVVLWRSWPRWRHVASIFAVVLVVLGGWTIVDRGVTEKEIALSAGPRFAELNEGSAAERLPVWRANIRAWTEDPILGSGPATSWGGYLANATAAEIRIASRGYGDTHNMAVELLVTTGVVGLLAALVLLIVLARVMVPVRPERSWALGAAIALAAVHLVQPFNLVLTPLLFLTAGLAVRHPERAVRSSRWFVLPLAVLLLASSARFGASMFERYGSTYASESALRTSLRLEPHRIGSSLELARYLAFEHRSGDRRAAPKARSVLRDVVAHHRWHPGIRIEAANIELALDAPHAASRWIADHLRLYPNDPYALASAASLALRRGDTSEAARFARRALSIDPQLGVAKSVLESAESG
jgi:O-antigen ligase